MLQRLVVLIVGILVFLSFISTPVTGTDTDKDPIPTTGIKDPLSVCKLSIAKLQENVASLPLPDHLETQFGTSVRRENDFDPNYYVAEVFKHLHMKQGYRLEYLYYKALGGAPHIYALPPGFFPYATFNNLRVALGLPESLLDGPYGPEMDLAYLKWVEAEDNEAGYLQYSLLRLMGGQFYLTGQGLFNDTRVLCHKSSIEAVEEVERALWQYQKSMPVKMGAAMLGMDFKPHVTLNPDTAIVQVVVFSKWGGIKEKTLEITRKVPHTVVKEEDKPLFEYRTDIDIRQ